MDRYLYWSTPIFLAILLIDGIRNGFTPITAGASIFTIGTLAYVAARKAEER